MDTKRTLVIGASGRIGEKLITLLHGNGCAVVAMLRDVNKGPQFFSGNGVETVQGDLETDIDSVFADCERVVFSAGSGADTSADKTLLVDLWGACKVVDAAKKNNISHFVMVSSRGADNPDRGPMAIKPYLIAKHFADNYLIASGLPYTILRPGRLLDEAGTGFIGTTRPASPETQVISREDTASAIYHCLANNNTIGQVYELYKGATPISEAFDAMLHKRH